MDFFSLKKKVYLSEISSVKRYFSKVPKYSFNSISDFGSNVKKTLFFFDGKNYNKKFYNNLDAVILVSSNSS